MVTCWLYCIFSNEEKLLPFFLRHYALQVDRMILFDNASTDNSRDIINVYQSSYAKIDVFNYPADRAVMDSVQAAQFANEKYKEVRGCADFVLWVDCDEFLWSGPVSLRESLRGYKQENIRAIQAQGYQMVSDVFPAGDAPITDQIHYGIRDAEYDKVCIFDPELNLQWRPGRHVCNIAENVTAYQTAIKLLHYRYLCLEFFQRRNAYNYGNRSEAEIQAGRSYHAASNHQGKYSVAWYRQAQAFASDVVSFNLVEA